LVWFPKGLPYVREAEAAVIDSGLTIPKCKLDPDLFRGSGSHKLLLMGVHKERVRKGERTGNRRGRRSYE